MSKPIYLDEKQEPSYLDRLESDATSSIDIFTVLIGEGENFN
jgi:hypothetical protein